MRLLLAVDPASVDACNLPLDDPCLFGDALNPEWGAKTVDAQALAQSWVDAQQGLGRAERALDDYISKASATTAGTFGWFLNDEHHHTRYESMFSHKKLP